MYQNVRISPLVQREFDYFFGEILINLAKTYERKQNIKEIGSIATPAGSPLADEIQKNLSASNQTEMIDYAKGIIYDEIKKYVVQYYTK